jgi:hypothetical protein
MVNYSTQNCDRAFAGSNEEESMLNMVQVNRVLKVQNTGGPVGKVARSMVAALTTSLIALRHIEKGFGKNIRLSYCCHYFIMKCLRSVSRPLG